MNKKLVAVMVVAAFAVGRYTVSFTEKKEETTIIDKNVDKDKHRETTKVETRHPDGSVDTVTKTVEDTKTDTVVKSVTDKTDTKESGGSKLNLSALYGTAYDFKTPPVYGLSASKEVLGPITAGAWGLSSGVFGLSVGLSF